MTNALAPAITLIAAAQTFACEPGLRGEGLHTIEGERHVVAWRAPPRWPLAEFVSLEFAACARDGRVVDLPRVDATMPAHGHGMNYRPQVTALGSGRFRADGLLLHMPGRWMLAFSVGAGSSRETLRDALQID